MKHVTEEISGFVTSASVTTTLTFTQFITNVAQGAVVALVSGIVGAFGAWLFKTVILPFIQDKITPLIKPKENGKKDV